MIHLAIAALLQAQQPPRQPVPQRNVADPGVIATEQRVSPAGVQSVFTGRVAGVKFGKRSDEVWVAAPSVTYRLDWRANRVVASAPLDGTPGVHGIAMDPAAGRVFVSSVGRLPATSVTPGANALRPRAVTYLSTLDSGITGANATPQWRTAGLGDYMAGSPSVATRKRSDGHRVAALPLPANDALAVIDAESGELLKAISLGVEPLVALISDDGSSAYVSVLGGPKPGPNDRSARQCCDPRAEAVRVDARGMGDAGSVSKVDLLTGAVRDVAVGRHPTAMAWDRGNARLYVALGNTDTVAVIDTRRDAVVARIAIAPFRQRVNGLAPTALALTPDGKTLFVALGGVNAVAMYDVASSARLLGLIPAAWYPASLDVSGDGKFLAVGALLGVGSGTGATSGKRGRYVHAVRGSVNVLPVPSSAELNAFTAAVAINNRLTLATSPAPRDSASPSRVARAVPGRPGDPSLIKHVVYVIRENRTYDQVLGDLGRGNGDSSLTIYGRDVTPNAHALSEQFVTLDHFFASGGNSADGHNWLTQANETDYPMWPLYFGRSYPSEGNDPLAYSTSGFLWETAVAKGKSVTVFGEYAPAPLTSTFTVRDTLMKLYAARPADYDYHRELLRGRYDTHSQIPSLDRLLVPEYPGWTQEVPDVIKVGDILSHLAEWEVRGEMPNLVMVILPNDHTEGTTPGWCTPRSCVADNDLALGKLVEGLTHSKFWSDMAILVVEDDAQNGVDHIDGHRTVALAISPYAKRGVVDSTFYAQPSMVKTIELMLGLPAMSIFDLVATDMRASFTDTRDLRPYTALEPKISLTEKNVRTGSITGPSATQRRAAALASSRMNFREPDAAPSEALNRILWHDARGWNRPYPGVKRALFFPMSVDIADEDRDERKEPD